MQNSNYRKTFALSQSSLKDFAYMSPNTWLNRWVKYIDTRKDEDHFDFGSLVDCLAFTPEVLNESFYVGDIKMPTDSVKQIADFVYENHRQMNSALISAGVSIKTPSLGDYEDLIYQKSQEKVWVTKDGKKEQKNLYGGDSYSRERIIKEVLQKGEEYFNKRCEVGGKTIVSAEDNMAAIELVEILRTNPVTRPFFIEQEGETLLFQHEMFLPLKEYGPIPFFIENGLTDYVLYRKCAMDIVRINHVQKTIHVPDFKTSFDSYKNNFIKHIKKFKYGTQASFYDDMIHQWAVMNYPDYTILPPCNITIDTTLKKPFIYEYDPADLKILKEGGLTASGYPVKGWLEIIKDIMWHIEHNIWDSCQEMEETGKIKVSLFE